MTNYNKLWLKCNVNDSVKFVPGPKGRETLLKKYGLEYMNAVHPGWEKDGAVIQMQFWEFIRVIGPITRMGVSDDYKTSIELEVYEENLREALNAAIHTSD